MNTFATTNNTGLLQDDYGDSGLSDALKRKRKKLAETKLGLINEEDDQD